MCMKYDSLEVAIRIKLGQIASKLKAAPREARTESIHPSKGLGDSMEFCYAITWKPWAPSLSAEVAATSAAQATDTCKFSVHMCSALCSADSLSDELVDLEEQPYSMIETYLILTGTSKAICHLPFDTLSTPWSRFIRPHSHFTRRWLNSRSLSTLDEITKLVRDCMVLKSCFSDALVLCSSFECVSTALLPRALC